MSNPKFAKVIRTFVRGTSAEQRLTLRAGREGTGKAIYSCKFWPHSSPSISQAYDYCHNVAEREGYTVVMEDQDA